MEDENTFKENTLKILYRTKELLERGWNKYAFALDDNNWRIRYDDPKACSWCLTGAIWKANFELYPEVVSTLQKTPYKIIFRKMLDILKLDTNLTKWNDQPERKKEDVIDLINKTIKELQA